MKQLDILVKKLIQNPKSWTDNFNNSFVITTCENDEELLIKLISFTKAELKTIAKRNTDVGYLYILNIIPLINRIISRQNVNDNIIKEEIILLTSSIDLYSKKVTNQAKELMDKLKDGADSCHKRVVNKDIFNEKTVDEISKEIIKEINNINSKFSKEELLKIKHKINLLMSYLKNDENNEILLSVKDTVKNKTIEIINQKINSSFICSYYEVFNNLFDTEFSISKEATKLRTYYAAIINQNSVDEAIKEKLSYKQIKKQFLGSNENQIIRKLLAQVLDVISLSTLTDDKPAMEIIKNNLQTITLVVDNAKENIINEEEFFPLISELKFLLRPYQSKKYQTINMLNNILNKLKNKNPEQQFNRTKEFDTSRKYDPKLLDGIILPKVDEALLCSTPFITIDQQSSVCLEDAISLQNNDDGTKTIIIAISDVTKFLEINPEIDNFSYQKMFSIYYKNYVDYCLPERISTDTLSLRPNQLKDCVVFYLKIDADANILDLVVKEQVVKSNGKYSYQDADRIIKHHDPNNEKEEMIIELSNISNIFINIFDNRNILYENNENIISTLMFILEKNVAEYFSKNKYPFIYRVHGNGSNNAYFSHVNSGHRALNVEAFGWLGCPIGRYVDRFNLDMIKSFMIGEKPSETIQRIYLDDAISITTNANNMSNKIKRLNLLKNYKPE